MRTLLMELGSQDDLGIVAGLLVDGIFVDRVVDVAAMLRCCDAHRYDVIIIELDSICARGVDALKCLRQNHILSPVFVIGHACEVEDRIEFLNRGADDYFVKPIDLRELKAKVLCMTRRQGGFGLGKVRIGTLILDTVARVATVNEQPLSLSPREFRLFELLATRQDQVIPKERLMNQLFGYEDDVGLNALELYVSRIRQKLRTSNVRIETVRCVGYVATCE